MKYAVFLLAIALPFVCAEEEYKVAVTFTKIKTKKDIVGKWSFSSEWGGYMGMALELTDKEYKYWFYSDVKNSDEPKYPLKGKWKLVDGVLILEKPERGYLYSETWVQVEFQGKVGLMAPENFGIMVIHNATPENRWIQKLPDEVKNWPLMNLPGKTLENLQK
jgi:hypothetical protein